MQRDSAADPVAAVRTAVARALRDHVPAQVPVVAALSGGRDSVVLLDALRELGPAHGHPLTAAHVHHGLSAHADAWAEFCAAMCTQHGLRCTTRRIDVPRGPQQSLEGEARRLRYLALAEMAAAADAPCVLLGHHRDDQAETLLLQLLRGAGPHGLAAMPPARTGPHNVRWVRPLLDISRAQIDAYAAARGLRWIDDDSNASAAHLRNALRQRVMPALASLNPAYAATLARAATHQADAARLADDLAASDAHAAGNGTTLDRAAFAALPPHRARNLLRWFLRQHALPAPPTSRLEAMLDQLRNARADAQTCLVHAGAELGVYRGRIALHAGAPPAFDVPWCGEPTVTLPHGVVQFTRTMGTGVDAQRLVAAPVHIRSRIGGERIRPAADRPRRALKSILHEAAIAPWARGGVPLIYSGDALAAVAGLAVDVTFHASPLAEGITIEWHPHSL